MSRDRWVGRAPEGVPTRTGAVGGSEWSRFTVRIVRNDGFVVVACYGVIDASTHELLYSVASELVTGRLWERVEIDLAEVTFCSVSGLRALLQLREFARRQAKSIIVRGASPAVQRLLDLLPRDEDR
jgi:anti-anti-sigma factor